MICPKGSESDSQHEVKTIEKAREWWPNAKEDALPITIDQSRSYDGRLYVRVYNKDGFLVHKRG